MKKLSVLFTAALLAGTAFAASARAGDELTVVSWGGAYSMSQKKAFVDPYNAAGNKVTEAEYNGEVAKIKAMVEAKAITWDVIDVDTATGLQGCAEGALETIDWAKLGLDRSKFIGGDLLDCAVPNIVYGTVFGYDTTKLAVGPTTINDFFDLAKFPGKRGIFKNPTVNLEWALIADGVDAKDVYTVLATPEGVDRAFKKLDTIKSELVYWEAGAQAPQLLLMRTRSPSRSSGITRVWIGIGGQSPRARRKWKKPIASSRLRRSLRLWPIRPTILPMVRPTRTPFQTSIQKPCRTCLRRLTTSRQRSTWTRSSGRITATS
jgi:spermidine/putrescine-binding protein